MADSLSQQANQAVIKDVQTAKPSQFVIGAHWRDGKFYAETTYDRKLSNAWGLTAYARAYWHDLPITVKGATATVSRPTGEAGVEIKRQF